MKKISLLFCIAIMGCTQPTTIVKLDKSTIEKSALTTQIQTLVDNAKVSGIAVSIFNKGEVVYKKAFGFANKDNQDSLSTDMVFYGASFSKAVFGYLVAQLVEEGVIDLDKPLQGYLKKPLPEYEFEKDWRSYEALKEDKRYEQITARMCLNHTTGFPNWRWMTRENDFFREGKIRFFFDPGERYYYSGEGMVLLQFVIEKITGKGLEELAQQRIFKPLNMNMTSYVWQERFNGNYCNGHTKDEKVIEKDTEDEANAAGSMETTLDDYSLFIKEIFVQAKQKSKVTELLMEPSVRITSKTQFGFQAWEETDENDDIQLSYGMGWGVMKSPYGKGMFKEGHGEGFQHYSIIFPEAQIGVVIFTNSDNGESIFKELLEITIGDTFTPWKWEQYIPYDLND